ncbi:MAG TPA: hypothetical protein VGM56_10980 [Byssovorax sp.]
MAENVARFVEAPRASPPPRDERACAGVSQIVPAHRATVVPLLSDELGRDEVRRPPARRLLAASPAFARRREHETMLVRVALPAAGRTEVARETLKPLPRGSERDAEERDATRAAALRRAPGRAPPDMHMRRVAVDAEVSQFERPLLALTQASPERERDDQALGP